MIWINTTGGDNLRLWVVGILVILMSPCIAVQAHTPNVMMSILKEDGPAPADILETAGFVAGDGLKFKMGDVTNNSTIRVSIDIDDDGVFNECMISDQEADNDIASINLKDNGDDADDDDDDDDDVDPDYDDDADYDDG